MHLRIDRRGFLAGGAAALALTLGPAPRAGAAQYKLTSLRTTVKSWLYIAEDYAIANQHFERAGLEVTSVANGRGVLVDILLGKGADLIIASPSQVLRARAMRRPVKILGAIIDRYASHIIVRKTILDRLGITEASDPLVKAKALKGLKIATPGPGSGADTLVRHLAEEAQIDPERDLTIVPVQGGASAMLAAFQQSVVDGFCFSSPSSDLAEARFGGAYLFHMSRNPPPSLAEYPYMIFAAREDTIEQQRPALRAYLKGMATAKAEMRADPKRYKEWARGFLEGMEETVFERAFEHDGPIALAPMRLSAEQFERCRDFVQREFNRLQISADLSKVTMADCIDQSLLTEAGA